MPDNNTFDRDLRATLREFLTLKYGLDYETCAKIAEEFSQFLVEMSDGKLTIIQNKPYVELTYTLTNTFELGKVQF